MTQIAAGVDAVAHHLLEVPDVREAAVALAVPDQRAVEVDLVDAPGAGDEPHLTHLERKSRQDLLGHPAGAQQPVALRAVGDGKPWLVAHTVGSPQLDMK